MVSDVIVGAFVWPEGLDFEEIADFCLRAEDLGYDLFQITDHFMNMRQPNRPDRHPLECWTTLAGLAAVTGKIRLGPLVACYAYRHPTVLAKMATTVDIISEGRLVFGLGAGWHEEEFKGYLGRFPPVPERLNGLEEAVEICKSMLHKERTTYHGEIFSAEDALNSPQPIQDHVPILVGGGGEKRTLRIVAEHADMCHFFAHDLETLDRKLEALKNHCASLGRSYHEVRKGVGVSVVIGRDGEEAEGNLRRLSRLMGSNVDDMRRQLGNCYGTTDDVAGFLEKYVARDVGLLTPRFFHRDTMELFAEEITPQIV